MSGRLVDGRLVDGRLVHGRLVDGRLVDGLVCFDGKRLPLGLLGRVEGIGREGEPTLAVPDLD